MINNKDSKSTAGDVPTDATDPAQAMALVLNELIERRGFDFTGYHPDMLLRRIDKRVVATGSKDFIDYLACLQRDEKELDRLLNVLTINVSQFFRDTLTFELIARRILPPLIREKVGRADSSLRIWSAGCARGEEPYSVAILIHELLEKEEGVMDLHLCATDINAKALTDAQEARYTQADHRADEIRLSFEIFHTGWFMLPADSRDHGNGSFFALRHT